MDLPSRGWLAAMSAVLLLGCSFMAIAVASYQLPFSWDIWYHIRIGEAFKDGFIWWDWGSFGPQGRPHLYPPGFHILLALLSLTGRVSVETITRFMPLVVFPATIGLFYVLMRQWYDRDVSVLAAFFAVTIPVSVDRGIISSPQAIGTLFMLAAFILCVRMRERLAYAALAGACLAVVILTHGLTLIVAVTMLALYVAFVAYSNRADDAALKRYGIAVLVLSAVAVLIPSYWLYYLFDHGVYSTIPESDALPLKLFPSKLGALQLGLSFLGIGHVLTRRDEGGAFLVMWLVATFLFASALFWVLPTRFIEFMALPVAGLAAVGLRELVGSRRLVAAAGVGGLLLVSLAAPYLYMHAISPTIYPDEDAAFEWLMEGSAEGGQVMTGWFFAPVAAALSPEVPIKGAYYSGSYNYRERTNDTDDFYAGKLSVLYKYGIDHVFVGRKERFDHPSLSFLDETDLLNKTYDGTRSTFYSVWEE